MRCIADAKSTCWVLGDRSDPENLHKHVDGCSDGIVKLFNIAVRVLFI